MNHCRSKKVPCNIVVTQPRRLAAINIAQRVCEERGWALGIVCGYQVRFNNSDKIIILFLMNTFGYKMNMLTNG